MQPALGCASGPVLRSLIGAAVSRFEALGVQCFEWKTRGHDQPADLGEHLELAGFARQEEETVLIGEIAALEGDVRAPIGIDVRRAGSDSLHQDVAAVGRLHAAVFPGHDPRSEEELFRRLREAIGVEELWLAETADEVVCAGRVTVSGTFAGLFGGATALQWRGRGIYRALTAARAVAAARHGATYVYAECTDYSRPILERAGLIAVTTTTPYLRQGRA